MSTITRRSSHMFSIRRNNRLSPVFLFIALGLFLIFTSCAPRRSRPEQLRRPAPPEIIYEHYGSFNLRIDGQQINRFHNQNRLRALKRRGFNTITIDVFDNFHPLVELQTWDRFQLPSIVPAISRQELESFIQMAEREGIAVWMAINTLPIPVSLKEEHNELFTYLQRWFMENIQGEHKPETESSYYLCPQHPMVNEFFTSLINELHGTYTFKGTVIRGINYPFLSHLPQHSFCLCQYCKRAAREDFDIDLTRTITSPDTTRQARQTLFYNTTLKNFIQYLRLPGNIPDSSPFLVEIIGDYSPFQNPYYQDYPYWSEEIPDIEYLFSFRSPNSLFEHFADIEMNVPRGTVLGLQVVPFQFRDLEHSIDDFFQFFFFSQPYTTLVADIRNAPQARVENFINILTARNILYPWHDPINTVKIILQTEHDAPYLTELSRERIAHLNTHLHNFLEAKNPEEQRRYRDILIDYWMQTTHLVNIKNTPALKNLQIAYKLFNSVYP